MGVTGGSHILPMDRVPSINQMPLKVNASKQSEGKEWIWAALTGLLLLAGAWLVLYTINPGLTGINFPTLSSLPMTGGGGGNGGQPGGGGNGGPVGSGAGGGASCKIPTAGPCSSVANLGCFGDAAKTMQYVCNGESSGNAAALGDIGTDGNAASVGLFQMNISANSLKDPKTGQTLNCPSAFNHPFTAADTKNNTVYVKKDAASQALYAQCKALAQDPTANIANACALSGNGTNLKPWATPATACK